MEKENYNKRPLTVEQQIELFKKRNILISDENYLKDFLLNNNYYKISYFIKKNSNPNTHFIFEDKIKSIEYYIQLYYLDRNLIKFCSFYLAIFEDFLKTRYAYYGSINSSETHFHLNKNNFINFKEYKKTMNFININYNNIKESKIKSHYDKKYTEPLPPIWVISELTTFGQYNNLIHNTKPEIIQEFYNIFLPYFSSKERFFQFTKTLVSLRNACAHNNPLYFNNGFKISSSCLELNTKLVFKCILHIYLILKNNNLDKNNSYDMNKEFIDIFSNLENSDYILKDLNKGYFIDFNSYNDLESGLKYYKKK